eukprot:CAMPEP_0182591364 /NCGR_PEP_ID=MMETSP1324-20130603/73620_1 /TAXON_ID=236786 /ORGANISM="Florenciella sp., Strain RCC1587" /LENGTH=46 /DNA_ID= /DNA_START= /DNA_END= /DNA_ORIENTATION=
MPCSYAASASALCTNNFSPYLGALNRGYLACQQLMESFQVTPPEVR